MNPQPQQVQVGKYKLIRKLAVGGMAEVYLAQVAGPAGFSKTLVLKRILPHLAEDQQFVEMFLNEARLAAVLNHPNVVSIFDLGESGGNYFIAMEFIDGPNLRTLCKKSYESGKQIPFENAAKIIALACEGLGYAHDFQENGQPMNLIHRDISPDNILLSRQGAVKVVDFGIAKAASQPHMTKTGTLKGKLAYMPPEQLRGKTLDRRADIFALGVVLYELISGQKPFDANSEVAAMQAILHDPPTPISERRADCPAMLGGIIERALEKDPKNRYPDCRTFQKDLEKFLISVGASVGSSDLAAMVNDVVPAAPIPLQTTPLPSSVPSEVELAAVEEEQSSSQPTQLKPASRGNLEAVQPQRTQKPRLEVIEDEPPPQRPAAGGSKGLYAVAAAIVVVGVGFGYLQFGRSEPRPVEVTPPPPRPPEAKVEIPRPEVKAVVAEPRVEPPPVEKKPEPVVVARVEPVPEPKKPEPVVVAAKVDPKKPVLAAGRPLPRPPEPKVVAAVEPPKPVAPVVGPTGISIESDPSCAVIVDGRAVGNSPVEVKDLSPGNHDVTLSNKEKGITRRLSVMVSAGELRHEKVKFGQGQLKILVRPWANVEIDGKPYGQTPLPGPIPLFEGEHRVRLTNPELHKDIGKQILIQAGKDEVVKLNFEE